MGIKKYEEAGKEFWKVYVHVRSKKNRKIRAQKLLVGLTSKEQAEKVYLKEYHRACMEIARIENDGLTWGEVIEEWREWYRRFPSDRWDESTVRDYIALAKTWTECWLDKPAKGLTVSDGYQMIEEAKLNGASTQRLYQIKTTVNVIFKWGIESGKILGCSHSPVFGMDLPKRNKESLPEILTRDEVAELLHRAEKVEHEWYPVWKVDAHTGLRASELDGLRKEDFDLVSPDKARELDKSIAPIKNYGIIRVQRQWKKKLKTYGELKGRYWRTVPVSSQLYWFLVDYLKNDFGKDEFGQRVFPELSALKRGQQAMVLKSFCISQGLKPIKFHTIRACFATHLLAAGVPEAKVMKVGGWKDRETMMIYIRMAGIDEAGATEALDLRVREEAVGQNFSNVVNLFSRK